MAFGVNVLICLSWYAYLANTDMFNFVQLYGRAVDQIIFEKEAGNELICSRLCANTAGCNCFSLTTGICKLARNSIVVSGSNSFVYHLLGSQPQVTVNTIYDIHMYVCLNVKIVLILDTLNFCVVWQRETKNVNLIQTKSSMAIIIAIYNVWGKINQNCNVCSRRPYRLIVVLE